VPRVDIPVAEISDADRALLVAAVELPPLRDLEQPVDPEDEAGEQAHTGEPRPKG
jgi:hypothetical protein